MELAQLRYFITVAIMENMSKAAEAMFVSQPNLSTSISRLESEVGVPLFDRRRGKITLNQNGALFLKSVQEAITTLDGGIQSVRNRQSGRTEPLSIACMVDDTALLEHFVLTNPHINLIHQRMDLPAITDLLERESIDLALTVLTPPGDQIAFERLYECEFVMLLNQDHPLTAYHRVSRPQLADERLAIDGSRINRDTFRAAEGSRGISPIIDYDVRHLDLLVSLVEANNCISIVPHVKYKELFLQGSHPSVVCRQYADGSPVAYWGLAYNKRRPLNAQGLCFRDFARDYFEGVDRDYTAACAEPTS